MPILNNKSGIILKQMR